MFVFAYRLHHRQRCCSIIRAPCHPPRAPMEMTATAVLTMAARPVPHLAGLARGSLNLAVLVKRCGCGCCSRACRCFVLDFPPARSSRSPHICVLTHMFARTQLHTHVHFAHTHLTCTSAHTCSHTRVRTCMCTHACPHTHIRARLSAHAGLIHKFHAHAHVHTSAHTLPHFLGAWSPGLCLSTDVLAAGEQFGFGLRRG